jgi:hypothetical protein
MADPPPKPKTLRRWAIGAVVAVFALGALFLASRQSFNSRAAKLRPGMSRAEVFTVMGQPDCLIRLHDTEIALYTPLPFELHALFTNPAQTLAGNPNVLATDFPVYIEFHGDRANRVRVQAHDVPPPPQESPNP